MNISLRIFTGFIPKINEAPKRSWLFRVGTATDLSHWRHRWRVALSGNPFEMVQSFFESWNNPTSDVSRWRESHNSPERLKAFDFCWRWGDWLLEGKGERDSGDRPLPSLADSTSSCYESVDRWLEKFDVYQGQEHRWIHTASALLHSLRPGKWVERGDDPHIRQTELESLRRLAQNR